jgi:hypothetical protein
MNFFAKSTTQEWLEMKKMVEVPMGTMVVPIRTMVGEQAMWLIMRLTPQKWQWQHPIGIYLYRINLREQTNQIKLIYGQNGSKDLKGLDLPQDYVHKPSKSRSTLCYIQWAHVVRIF